MADQDEKQERKGFTVQDRRRFSPETGEAREDVPDAANVAPAEPEAPVTEATGERAQEPVAGNQLFYFHYQPKHSSVNAFGRDRRPAERPDQQGYCRWQSR